MLRFLFGVQVIKVAEKYVKTVNGRQIVVTVTKVVLPELSALIT